MKKYIYIGLASLLGILVGTLAASLIERQVINQALAQGNYPRAYFYLTGYGYIPPYIYAGILLLGAVGGFYLGKRWWKAFSYVHLIYK